MKGYSKRFFHYTPFTCFFALNLDIFYTLNYKHYSIFLSCAKWKLWADGHGSLLHRLLLQLIAVHLRFFLQKDFKVKC